MSGYFKIWRDLFDKAIWTTSTPEQKTILVTLLSMANYRDKEWIFEGRKCVCKPGQFITSVQSVRKKCGKQISTQNVRTALEKFQELGFLTDKTTSQGRLITIVNWELYQGFELDSQQTKQQSANKPLTNESQTTNKRLTTREEGKEGEEREECIKPFNIYKGENSFEIADPVLLESDEIEAAPQKKPRKSKNKPDMNGIPYKEIIDYLNQKIGTKYKPETEFYHSFIHARWKEGFRLEDFQRVIDVKTAEWLGTDKAMYLRPETLFGKKFQSYLNQLPVPGASNQPSKFQESKEVKEYSWLPTQHQRQ